MIDAAYHARWRAANRERYLASQRKYRDEHREQRRETNRDYRVNNRERYLVSQRSYRERHHERRLQDYRLWRQSNLERKREIDRVYRRKAGVTAATKAWNLLNREKKREYNRWYNKTRRGGRFESALAKISSKLGSIKQLRKVTSMNNDKMIRFIKRWRELETQRRKLDFERSQWCREVRDEFPKGDVGDKAFTNWLVVELGVTAALGAELLERAVAGRAVLDSTTWDRVGGFSNIRALAPLAQRDRVAVLEAAKAGAKTVKTVMRERGLVATTSKVAKPDVVVLAEFIATLEAAPKDVMEIVRKYVTRKTIRGTTPQKTAA
jgi:hypothetical protein